MTPHETGATAPPPRTFGSQGPTLGELSDAYLQDYQVRQFRSQSTARGRIAHLTACFGRDARAAALTTYQIRQYQLARRARPGRPPAPSIAKPRPSTACAPSPSTGAGSTPCPASPTACGRIPPARASSNTPSTWPSAPTCLPRGRTSSTSPTTPAGARTRSSASPGTRSTRPAASSGSRPPARRRWWGEFSPFRNRLPRPWRGDGHAATPDSPLVFPPRRHPRPPLAHGVAHRLSGGRGADSLPPRLPPHRRPQPDPRQCPRARRYAPDRPQDPRHLRPLQHHQRTGTARGRGSACRLSGAARTGDAAWQAAPPSRHRRPAHHTASPPRAAHHRVSARRAGHRARRGWTHGSPQAWRTRPAHRQAHRRPTARDPAAAATSATLPQKAAHTATGGASGRNRSRSPVMGPRRRATRRSPPTARGAPDGQRVDEDHA